MSHINRSNIDQLLPSIICCLANKGYARVSEINKGCTSGPCEDLSYLVRLSKVLSGWYPKDYVIQQGYGPYYAFKTAGMTFPLFYTILAPNGRGGNITLFNQTAANLNFIRDVINVNTVNTGFSAAIKDGNFWIYAPYGYEGAKLTGNFVSIQIGAGRLYTIYGFQGQKETIIADEPCIDNDQAERMLEVFKSACSICSPAQTVEAGIPLIG